MGAAQPKDAVRRVLDDRGRVIAGVEPPEIPSRDLVRALETMQLSRALDARMSEIARAGRLGFYLETRGEEACHLAVYPLRDTDWVFPGLREQGAWLWRGHDVADIINQLLGNERDPTHGRQMPTCHSARSRGMVSVSAPVGTQIPQAVGVAHAAKIAGKDDVAMAFFGSSSASVGAFHVGLNFAGVYKAPAVLVCRSTGSARDSGVAELDKGIGYGIPSVRVDGDDVLAMMQVASEAVSRARAGDGPTLIIALTRSTDPIARFRSYLMDRELWSQDQDREVEKIHRSAIDRVLHESESAAAPSIDSLFEDVYEELPWNLIEQRAHLRALQAQERDDSDVPEGASRT